MGSSLILCPSQSLYPHLVTNYIRMTYYIPNHFSCLTQCFWPWIRAETKPWLLQVSSGAPPCARGNLRKLLRKKKKKKWIPGLVASVMDVFLFYFLPGKSYILYLSNMNLNLDGLRVYTHIYIYTIYLFCQGWITWQMNEKEETIFVL